MSTVEDLITKKIKKASKKGKNIDLFSSQADVKKNQEKAQLAEDDDDADFVITTNVIDSKQLKNSTKGQLDLNKLQWEEKEIVAVIEEEPEEKQVKKKTIAWGEKLKETQSREVAIEDNYFPSLDDKNAEKARPKPKPKTNEGLFGTGGGFMSRKGNDDLLDEGPRKFGNTKGHGGLAKFLATDDPNDPLAEKVQPKGAFSMGGTPDGNPGLFMAGNAPAPNKFEQTTDTVITFKGKAKIGYEESEAELRRKAFMQDIQEEPKGEKGEDDEVHVVIHSKKDRVLLSNDKPKQFGGLVFSNEGLFSNEVTTLPTTLEEKPRAFTNSKGPKNMGLFRSDDAAPEPTLQITEEQEPAPPRKQSNEETGKRIFVNSKNSSKKNNGLISDTPEKKSGEVVLKNWEHEVKGEVLLKGWD